MVYTLPMHGYFFAITSSLFFSLYIIPRKLSKQPPLFFSFFMACGFSIGSILIYVFFPNLHTNEIVNYHLWWSVLAGSIWAAAFVAFVTAVDYLGLAKSNQWKNLQGPVGVLLSLLVLREFTSANPIFTILAALLVFISALFFTMPNLDQKRSEMKKGISLALLSALGFGSVATIQKYVTTEVGIYAQQVVWSISIVFSLLAIIARKRKLNQIREQKISELKLSVFAGFAYLGASYLQLISYQYIEASIGFTLIQMNALWTILIGIFIFKEIDLKIHGRRVLLGFLCALLGILVLSFAKK